MTQLLISEHVGTGQLVDLGDGETVIGRGKDADITLDDSRVSRRHAVLRFEGGACVLHDLGSANGTRLNDRPVLEPAILRPGDRVQVGRTTMVFDPNRSSVLRMDQEGGTLDADSDASSGTALRDLGSETNSDPVSSDTLASADLDSEAVRLRLIYSYADRLRRRNEVHAIVMDLLGIAGEILEPDRAAVFLTDPGGGGLRASGSMSWSGGKSDATPVPIDVSSSVLNQCLDERVPVLVDDSHWDARFRDADSLHASEPSTILCYPLGTGDAVVGVLYADRVGPLRRFSPRMIRLMAGVAGQAAMAISSARRFELEIEHNRMSVQMRVARRIHDRLLAEAATDSPVACIRRWNRASSRIGGDFFVSHVDAQGTLAAIADGAGHGIGAALLMTTVRAYLIGTLAGPPLPLGDLVARLNRLTAADVEPESFVTMMAVRIAPDGRSMEIVGAGHEPPLVFRPRTGEFLDINVGGAALGLIPDARYDENARIATEPGDRVLLFTDGVIEQQDASKEIMGLRRLRAAFAGTASMEPDRALAVVVRHLDEWRGEEVQADDITLVVIEIRDPDNPPTPREPNP